MGGGLRDWMAVKIELKRETTLGLKALLTPE